MREAGLVVARTLEKLRQAVTPGHDDHGPRRARRELDPRRGRHPVLPELRRPLGQPGFPGSICASVNDEVVHGIPGPRVLREGDLLSIDCGAILDGWHGDSAITVPVGEVAPEALELSRVCEASLWAGLAAAQLGGRLTDISHAVEAGGPPPHRALRALRHRRQLRRPRHRHRHAPGAAPAELRPARPRAAAGQGPCAGRRADGHPRNAGHPGARRRLDRRHRRRRWAAHWEHTVAITEEGPWVLTAFDGGVAKLAELGVKAGQPVPQVAAR